jgi:hypothetical protein
MRLVRSFSNQPAGLRGPKFYAGLTDRQLSGRNFRDALYVAERIVAKYRGVSLYTLPTRQREERRAELKAVAVMLQRLSDQPYRWYTRRRAFYARQTRVRRLFADTASLLGVPQRSLNAEIRKIRGSQDSAAA